MWYALIKGLSLGLLLSISVGPLLFTTIKQSINNGTRGGMAFIAGVALSDLLLAVAVNFFTELFTRIITGKEIVGIVGSLFLVGVGVYFLFFKKIKVAEDGLAQKFRKRDFFKLFVTGFLMNVLNPGIWLFWLAAASSFADHSMDQRLAIFGIALAFVLGTDVLKVLGAGKIRERLTPHNIQFISRLNGFILICFGVGLQVYYLFFQHHS